MFFYFLASPTADIISQKRYQTFISHLEEKKVKVMSNISPARIEHAKTPVEFLLSGIDAFVIEQSAPAKEIGFILNIAFLAEKPLLYVYPRYASLSEYGWFLKRKANPYVKLQAYDSLNLGKVVNHFLSFVESHSLPERANVKFTLRLTREMDYYLTWKCQRMKKTKANFLRDVILKNFMQKDKQFLKEKRVRE